MIYFILRVSSRFFGRLKEKPEKIDEKESVQ